MRAALSSLLDGLGRHKGLHGALLIPVLFVLVLSIRFNGQDLLIGEMTMTELEAGEYSIDIENYISYVECFRNEDDIRDYVDPPYLYRPVTPLIAQLLPFEPITSINVINVLCLAFTLILMYNIVKDRTNASYALFSQYLMILSFPFFYYGSVGNIDPGSLFMITLGIFLYEKVSPVWAIAILPIALLQKEVTILYLFYIAGDWLRSVNAASVSKSVLLLGGGLLLYMLLKSIFPEGDYMWAPGTDFLNDNLARPRAYLAPLLSLGVPFMIIMGLFRYGKWAEDSMFLLSIAALFGLLVYAFTSAYMDGRFVFIGYSVLCMYSAILVKRCIDTGKPVEPVSLGRPPY